uniref:RNA helicase n=1 Tax=Meloidogyne javanica TaxID=6303 RepID=A0A915MPP2_MELJA
MDNSQQQTPSFVGRGRGMRGRANFGNVCSRTDSIPDNNDTTSNEQQQVNGRGGTRFGLGRGIFGNDTSKTNNFSAINNSSTTDDDQQNTIFNGRGGTRGRSRGSFGNNAAPINNSQAFDNNSTTSNQQSVRGKAPIRSWRGNNRDGSRTNSNGDVRDTASLGGQKSAIFNGRGGTSGRSRGSSFGNNAVGSRTNSNGDVRDTASLGSQQSTKFIGRGVSRGIGRGNSVPQTNTSDFNNSSTTNNQQFRGRGGFSSGRGNGRGNFASGANSVPLLESISVERPNVRNNCNTFNNDFERRQRSRQPSFSNASTEDFARKRQSRSYRPVDKPIEEVFAQDQECKEMYIDVTDQDDNVEIYGIGSGDQRIFENWNELNLHPALYENIMKAKYIRPRKIQSYVIPYLLDGCDLKGHSETGSGKTGAFAIPIIQKILSTPEFKRELPGPVPLAVIIEPTRELCIQVYDQFRKFANGTFIKVCKVYGETNMGDSIAQITKGCDILIATPGRIKHFIVKANFVDISKLKFFVLDEVDHMLNTKFLEDIRALIEFPRFPTKSNRQCLLFSATFPHDIQQLASELLRDQFVFASNKKPVSPNSKIVQNFYQVETNHKTEFLLELLQKELDGDGMKNCDVKLRRTLVFVETRRDADRVSVYLVENDIKSSTINGDRTQSEREDALRKFEKGEIDVLVATDLLMESDIEFPAFMNLHSNGKSKFYPKDTQEENNCEDNDDDW